VIVYILSMTTAVMIALLVIVLLLYKVVTLLERIVAILVRMDERDREARRLG
jgi:hypothetical protein